MRKKYIVSVLIPALIIQLCGCYSMKEISKDEMAELKDGGDLIVYTRDSTIYSFKESNYNISNDTLNGKGYVKFSDNSDFKVETEGTIALTNIKAIEMNKLNAGRTTWLIIGGILLLVAGVLFLQLVSALSGR